MTSAPIFFEPEILLAGQDVRVALFDVDGVLTDGGLYYTEDGEQIKRFHVQDGYGLKLLRAGGITPAVITGRDSPPLRRRMQDLGIEHVHYGVEKKLPAAQALLEALGLDWSQAAVIGDDWPDLPLLACAALPVVPANAHPEARALARYVTRAHGGAGAAREFCDLLLTATGRYRALRDALLEPSRIP
ncbi:MAG: HAD hydrolase family protein [Burkholderiaceae bacterium]|jgi:3-deoxy-D-manno-octulosonate 8-phosphate phosphatase (KDO 8-P phosphatase)|nr:HAD hydrolase family protein [Burkholderiaceae bacterium]